MRFSECRHTAPPRRREELAQALRGSIGFEEPLPPGALKQWGVLRAIFDVIVG